MKTTWSKILFIASDTLLATYLLFAFCSFDKKGEAEAVCSKVNINIADSGTNGFLDAGTIKKNLQQAKCYPEINSPISDVNTRRIEETLIERTPFVKTAECYKTVDGHVYITVTQRMPVIRIMAENGDNYYVDDNDRIMKGANYTSDLIIASGCINRAFATTYLSPLGKAIMNNNMWRNLIEQVNVLPDRSIEIIPRIGNHIVCLGPLPEAKNKEEREKAILNFLNLKMTRLEKFYKYGLSTVGWNKYSYINIEFDNQIICRKSDHALRVHVDSQPAVNNESIANHEEQTTQTGNGNGSDSQTNKEEKKETEKKTPIQNNSEKNSTEKKATEKRDSEKKSSEKKAADKKPVEKKSSDKKSSEKKSSDKKSSEKKSSDRKSTATKKSN